MNRYRYALPLLLSVSYLICCACLSAATEDLSQTAITCSVLEAHTNTDLGVSVALFHQLNKNDAARLGAFLREHSDASVEFQTADGVWHKAWVARLKTSFGRGLLLFATDSAQLKEKDSFVLKLE